MPKEVKLAVTLQLALIIVAWIVHVASRWHTVSQSFQSRSFEAIPLRLMVPFILTCAIYLGQNWARILYLVLWPIGVLALAALFAIPSYRVQYWGSSMGVIFSVARICISGFALFLLFSAPSNAWFRHLRAPKPPPIQT